jgi:ferredoxin
VDVFDWAVGRWFRRLHLRRRGGWVHARFYVLAAVLAAAALGVMLAGYVAAIPVATRGAVFLLGPAQLAWLKHPGMVRAVERSYWVSVGLFAAVLGLGLLGRRFWCRDVCPSGALYSVASLLRLRERRVGASCVGCGKCVAACAFDAIRSDFSTRPLACAWCTDCAAACPVDAIEFGWRRRREAAEPSAAEPRPSRRAFLGASAAGAFAGLGMLSSRPAGPGAKRLLRPPGSVAEEPFLALCVRCGECIKACPGPVLHPAGLEAGLDAVWTPVAVPTWAGCHQECNFCGQVCPTGAIRPLPLEVKRRTHMGLAVVDPALCLPHRGEQDCRLCVDECTAAGYDAIALRDIELEVGEVPEGVLSDMYLDAMGSIPAPFVNPDACVGCGLCEYRCSALWAKQRGLLPRSAIVVVPQNEDRPG